MRILVIDDEPILLRMISAVLRASGHDVTTASSGIEALKIVSGNSYDVILSDVCMPGLNGPESMDRLLSPRATKIVFMSGASSESLEGLKKWGGTAFIKKPFRMDDLMRVLRSATVRSEVT